MLKKSRLATPMVAAVAAALVSGSLEMVQPESAPARMLVARIALMRRCHLLRCAMMCPLLAVEIGGIVASGGDGCIAGLCKVGWANVRQPENVLRWFGGKRFSGCLCAVWCLPLYIMCGVLATPKLVFRLPWED